MYLYPGLPKHEVNNQCMNEFKIICVMQLHSHWLGEKAGDLLAVLIISSTDTTLVKLLVGSQLSITACLDAFALDTDR